MNWTALISFIVGTALPALVVAQADADVVSAGPELKRCAAVGELGEVVRCGVEDLGLVPALR